MSITIRYALTINAKFFKRILTNSKPPGGRVLFNTDKRIDRIISSFLLFFLGITIIGLIIFWLVGLDEVYSLFTVPELLLGSFFLCIIDSVFHWRVLSSYRLTFHNMLSHYFLFS